MDHYAQFDDDHKFWHIYDLILQIRVISNES